MRELTSRFLFAFRILMNERFANVPSWACWVSIIGVCLLWGWIIKDLKPLTPSWALFPHPLHNSISRRLVQPHLVINDEFHSYLARSWAPKTLQRGTSSLRKEGGLTFRWLIAGGCFEVDAERVNTVLKLMELNEHKSITVVKLWLTKICIKKT